MFIEFTFNLKINVSIFDCIYFNENNNEYLNGTSYGWPFLLFSLAHSNYVN